MQTFNWIRMSKMIFSAAIEIKWFKIRQERGQVLDELARFTRWSAVVVSSSFGRVCCYLLSCNMLRAHTRPRRTSRHTWTSVRRTIVCFWGVRGPVRERGGGPKLFDNVTETVYFFVGVVIFLEFCRQIRWREFASGLSSLSSVWSSQHERERRRLGFTLKTLNSYLW